MMRDFLVKLLVRNAVNFESAKVSFYEKAAGIVKDERAKALLEHIAEEERKHMERLEAFGEGSGESAASEDRLGELGGLGLEEVAKCERIGPDSSVREILRTAVELERSAYDFYFLLSEKAKLHGAKRALALLAKEEHDHLSLLEKELANTT